MLSYYSPQTRQSSSASLPSWVYQQRYSYPHHPRHSELINIFLSATNAYGEALHNRHLCAVAHLNRPDDEKKSIEEKSYAEKVTQTGEKLSKAEQELRAYIGHAPAERISLYVSEIAELQPHLEQAKAAEHEYTTQLLNDPDVAKKRLERMIHGHTGLEAEYDGEQLSRLRSLRGAVEHIESKIRNCESDIADILKLADQAEQRVKVNAAMSKALPAFKNACVEFLRAWAELKSIASEHQIEFYDQQPKLPSGATFKQSANPHDGNSRINLIWK